MLKNADYIFDNIIKADNKNTTKAFCKKAQVGVDVSLRIVRRIASRGCIFLDRSAVSIYKDLKTKKYKQKDGWLLRKGTYIAVLNEGCAFGAKDTGLIILRSSLNRCGVSIESAVWDPGYTSVDKDNTFPMSIRITVNTPRGIFIEKNARIAQLIVMQNNPTALYNGQFQGGRVASKLTDKEGGVKE